MSTDDRVNVYTKEMSFPTSKFIRGYRALEPLNPETYFRSPEPRTLNPTLPEKGLCSLRMLSVSVYLGCPLEDTAASVIRKLLDQNRPSVESYLGISLVGREWKNGSHSSYKCTPFLHSLLTKGLGELAAALTMHLRSPPSLWSESKTKLCIPQSDAPNPKRWGPYPTHETLCEILSNFLKATQLTITFNEP